MESEHGNISNKNFIPNEVGKTVVNENSPDFYSHSSRSSSCSSITSEKCHLRHASAKSEFDDLSSDPESFSSPEVDIPTSATPQWSMVSESSPDRSPLLLMMKCPPPSQIMGQSDCYDPNRIPTSIFSAKPSNPMDWSTASNESLFSIQMGNNSFCDPSALFGKSEELAWLDEYNNNHPQQNQVSSLPPVMEVPSHEEGSVRLGKVSGLEKEDSDKKLKCDNEKHLKEKINPVVSADTNHTSTDSRSFKNPRLSDDSGNSGSSFAFPILENDGGKESPRVVANKNEKTQSESEAPKAFVIRWCSCFSWWPRRS